MTITTVERRHGDYEISTDPTRVDPIAVHDFLATNSYWAQGRDYDTVDKSIRNSPLVCSAFAPNGQFAGFARMVTDLATFAWLCDVFVLSEHRGHGLGIAIVETLVEHPELAGIKRQVLATGDAHDLYAKFGFEPMGDPDGKWMSRLLPQ